MMAGETTFDQPPCAFDVQRIRRDFPILKRQVDGKSLIYLDNAATTQKPQAVIDAVTGFYARECSSVHRGAHYLSERATAAYEAARLKVQRFMNAASIQEIVFVRGATEGINLVAQSYGRSRIRPGDEILISAMEHHSNIVPWQMLCEEAGARLRVAPINSTGELIVEDYARMLNPKTRLAAVTHVSNVLGTVKSSAWLTNAAFPYLWTALSPYRTCGSTYRHSTAISSCSQDTRFMGRPESAFCMERSICWMQCLLTRLAAT
jgi:selenocysteine lyase/cysteine desulfurase